MKVPRGILPSVYLSSAAAVWRKDGYFAIPVYLASAPSSPC
jgi:hypothetical protein